MPEEDNDVFDVITVDDQMITDVWNLDEKLRYHGFNPVGLVVSYQAKFLFIRDLRNKSVLSVTRDGKPELFGLLVEADPMYDGRDFCIVLETGERVKSMEVETDRVRKQTRLTLNLDDKGAKRFIDGPGIGSQVI